MNRLALAWRNVARHRRRSLLTGGIVAFGFAALVLAGGFMAQSFEGLRTSTIRGGIGHLQIADARAFRGSEQATLEFGLRDAPRLTALLAADPEVAAVLPRIEFLGLASNGRRSIPFLGLGVDPRAEASGSDIPSSVQEGRWLPDDQPRGLVLGAGLARALNVRVGDVLTLLATTPDGTLNAVDGVVAGLADIRVRELNERYLAAALPLARQLLDTPDAVSRISVLLREPADAEASAARLRPAMQALDRALEVRSWRELAPFYEQVRLLYLGIFGFMGIVLITVVFLATINTTLMSVTERTREIGTLRALGARPARIVGGFLAEGLVLGFGACLAGAALAATLSLALNASGIVLPPPPGATRGFPINIRFYLEIYAAAAVVLTAAVTAAAWVPARRGARVPIVEALAHV